MPGFNDVNFFRIDERFGMLARKIRYRTEAREHGMASIGQTRAKVARLPDIADRDDPGIGEKVGLLRRCRRITLQDLAKSPPCPSVISAMSNRTFPAGGRRRLQFSERSGAPLRQSRKNRDGRYLVHHATRLSRRAKRPAGTGKRKYHVRNR